MRTTTRGRRIQEPREYRFNRPHQIKYADRMWRCPVRLISSGAWAELWRAEGTVRGGGAASSILPVLGLQVGELADGPQEEWSSSIYLSRRRLAKLAGLDKDTVGVGLKHLADSGLIQIEHSRKAPGLAGRRTRVRLSNQVLSSDRAQHVPISGAFIYGGTWSLMHPAWRHLYVAIAAEDAIDRTRQLRLRKRHEDVVDQVLSYDDLMTRTGLARSGLAVAVKALRTPVPIPPGAEHADHGEPHTGPIVDAGVAPPRHPRWYTPSADAQRTLWPPELLEDRDAVRQVREEWLGGSPASPLPDRPSELPRYYKLPEGAKAEYEDLLTRAAASGRWVHFDYVKPTGDRSEWVSMTPGEPFRRRLTHRAGFALLVRARPRRGKYWTFLVSRMRRLRADGVGEISFGEGRFGDVDMLPW